MKAGLTHFDSLQGTNSSSGKSASTDVLCHDVIYCSLGNRPTSSQSLHTLWRQLQLKQTHALRFGIRSIPNPLVPFPDGLLGRKATHSLHWTMSQGQHVLRASYLLFDSQRPRNQTVSTLPPRLCRLFHSLRCEFPRFLWSRYWQWMLRLLPTASHRLGTVWVLLQIRRNGWHTHVCPLQCLQANRARQL